MWCLPPTLSFLSYSSFLHSKSSHLLSWSCEPAFWHKKEAKSINDYRSQLQITPSDLPGLPASPSLSTLHSIRAMTASLLCSSTEKCPTALIPVRLTQYILGARHRAKMFSSLCPMLAMLWKEVTILLLLLSPVLFKLCIWWDLYLQHHSLNPNQT